MVFEFALKIFSDCCIIFAILGAFPAVFSCSHPLLFMAAAAAAAAGLAALCREKGRSALSRACALLPFSGLFLAAAPMELCVLLPASLYSAAVILRGSLQLEYYSFRQFFLRSLCLLGALFVILSAFTVLEGLGGEAERMIHPEITLRYSLVHLLCGVILQRQLRLGAFGKGHGGTGQMAAMLGGTGLVLFGFVLAEPALRKGGALIFQLLLSVVLSAVMAGLELFSYLLDQVELNTMSQQIAESREDTLPSYNLGVMVEQIQKNNENSSESSLWWIIPVAILLLGAMALMILSFRKRSSEAQSIERISEAPPMKTLRRDPRRSYRWRIRQLYCDFLRFEQKQGLSLKKSHTSLDVLRQISPDTNSEAAEILRGIYISARYDLGREPGRDDYEAAKAAMKKCRNQI